MNVHGCNDECGDIHGNFIKNSEDLTLKQMFDVTAQFVNDQEEIHGLDKNSMGKEFLETSLTDW